jgi:hypothetical protein
VLYYQNPDDPALLDEYHSGIEYFIEKPFGSRPDTFLRSIPKTVVSEAEAKAEIRCLYPHITNGGAPTVDSPAASGPAEAPASRSRGFLRRLIG